MQTPEIELEDFLAFDDSGETPLEIEGEVEAASVMRRVRAIRRRIAKNREVAEAETDRINLWEREVNAPLEQQALFFESRLEGYMRHVRETTGRKSLSLPAGKITTTAKSEKWEVADKDAFLTWARSGSKTGLYAVEYKPAPLAALKAAFVANDDSAVDPETGETIPGVAITQPETAFSISVKPNL